MKATAFEPAEEKITFFMPSFRTGGGNRVFVELANQIVKEGYRAEILHPATNADTLTFSIDKRVRVIRVGKTPKNSLIAAYNVLKALLHVVFKNRKNRVIVSDPILSLLIFAFNKKRTYRFLQADDYIIFDDLYLLKSRLILQVYKGLTRVSFQYKTNYIFNSRFVYESFQKISGRRDVPFNIVRPGIDPQVFYNRKTRQSHELNICIIGRSHPWKGFADFVLAWRELKKAHASKIKSIYVVSPDDLSQFDLADFTHIKPSSDEEIARIYNNSHIFISTSWWEGFGLPQLEAMACGCAVILTDAGGILEYAEPNYNCLMYKPKDVEELKKKIALLLDDPALRTRLADGGEKTARKFTWNDTRKEFEVIITNC